MPLVMKNDVSMKKPITGTFIDEITYDIPSSNWSDAQWMKELEYMKDFGIDTLIFIRGGMYHKSIFPSKVLGTLHRKDFAGMIMQKACDLNMDVFFGLYVSNLDWNNGDYLGEFKINKPLITEVLERYGHMPCFKGWYIPQEAPIEHLNITELFRIHSAECKDQSPDKKVLISPFFQSDFVDPQNPYSPAMTYEEWDRIFGKNKDIDICAFQDGTAPVLQMDAYYREIEKLCKKYGVALWANVETFERDVRHAFFPISFADLKEKIDIHQNYAEKMITFEFSHFLSPQSIYPSARNLYELYKQEYF